MIRIIKPGNKIKYTITCPDCGFLLARTLPGAKASGLLLYCRKCRKQVAINIPKTEP